MCFSEKVSGFPKKCCVSGRSVVFLEGVLCFSKKYCVSQRRVGLFEEVLLRFVKLKIPHTEWPAGWQSKKTHGGGIIATRMIRKIDPLAVSKEILEIETHQLVTFRFDNKMNTLGVAVQDRHMNDTCEATCVLMREILDIGARAQQTYKGKSK